MVFRWPILTTTNQYQPLETTINQHKMDDCLVKWQCVKTLYPCSSHQKSWDSWMFIPLKMVLIGIDPYPNHLKIPPKKKSRRRPGWKTELLSFQFPDLRSTWFCMRCTLIVIILIYYYYYIIIIISSSSSSISTIIFVTMFITSIMKKIGRVKCLTILVWVYNLFMFIFWGGGVL